MSSTTPPPSTRLPATSDYPPPSSSTAEEKGSTSGATPVVGFQQADILFDVLGGSNAEPARFEGANNGTTKTHNRSSSSSVEGNKKEQQHDTRSSHLEDASPSSPWTQHIRQVVRETVLDPLREKNDAEGTEQASGTSNSSHEQSPAASPFKVLVVDALGMPADLPRGAPRNFEGLLELSPAILREQLQRLMERKGYRALTAVQAAAIPLMLEYRDVLCIAPTATGKSLCYVYASLLRLLLSDINGRSASAAAPAADGGVNLNRRQVEAFLQEKIDSGEVCPYCELSIAETRVCPMTGFPHPSPSEVEGDLALRSQERRAMRLEELRSSVAEPRVLVLVPTSQLARQVYTVYRTLRCDYRIHCMVRASNPEEQRKYLQALEKGVDVLVCAPETILPALYKHKLSLKRVQTVIMDEVDDMVSVNHFEPLKIVLGALPKGALRPQRLLLGASLPPVAYAMIKSKMLLPSHRFVLVDLKTPMREKSPVQTTSSGSRAVAAADSVAPALDGVLTAQANLRHLIFMVGRAEKAQKLAWLYQTGKLTADQRTLIFCNSRHNVAYVHDKLKELVPGVNVTTLTSHASSTAREGVLKMFRTGVSSCLICTDLLSRGIDFEKVVYVVHYDMPADMETWMHRCGRCGRGGLLRGHGYIYTFFQPENVRLAKPLVAYLRQQRQLVPPKLQEYAKQSFIDVFNNSLFHHPTRPYRKDDPQHTTSVLGRGTRRFPDYKQGAIHKHFRPQ
ncbi:putative DEAD/DEAH box helicase putativeRNA helicase [Leptomonas pyrrhocoris]|uniref:Putative DEAD/DEAH box helicase putativeRNA helicase n=1 Tax=Leptomonas pyrrhocoris TaxID=157538 RepID=A0A0M9G134_LEPPY|nr:putative DEAD/DEAH box helicase putativeRNA helicase [Leptomonas pyrrhocoris]XP_015658680.1 putative DEAD/DEAH box helicase putativeRNA helicase [Leptomonas pyrrhocoris]KPA80240.1 putative DEAD/DEAH box helicase putativeRNA helicase [Leptomonas pyrrhocoris]KPA80241.1 putative DEAD/DEAH box helicase putativeRNA helicase [Leptomonas pyrrhocoris]|eukprot:XP_015658679.1 putative DEAD/DEAH box helicase putativeRNA helicase [Leptomonas pyrrhocoris]